MLREIISYDGIDGRKLMDVYRESNTENIPYFFPEAGDDASMLPKIERNFLRFIETEFLPQPGNAYWVLEEDGVWVSALRLYQIRDDFYYLEALETRPDFRRRGCAARLLTGVIEELKKRGPFRLCDSVSKRNEPSIRTHKKCGFAIASEAAEDYLRGGTNERQYGMRYSFP